LIFSHKLVVGAKPVLLGSPLFSPPDDRAGISGALAKGEIYQPAKTGTLVYFNTDDIDQTLMKAQRNGSQILCQKNLGGEFGICG